MRCKKLSINHRTVYFIPKLTGLSHQEIAESWSARSERAIEGCIIKAVAFRPSSNPISLMNDF